MSLTVYVSSIISGMVRIEDLLRELKSPCNITKHWSVVERKNQFISEPGFKLHFLKIANDDFKDRVWPILVSNLNITCAFVIKEHEYMGCVLNWPGLFRPNYCQDI